MRAIIIKVDAPYHYITYLCHHHYYAMKVYEHSHRNFIKEEMYLLSVICLPSMNTRKHVTEDLYNSQRKTSTCTLLENGQLYFTP